MVIQNCCLFQVIHTQEGKIGNLTSQLEKHYEMQRSVDSRAARVEGDFVQMKNRMRQWEDELGAADALRDGMRNDKEKVIPYIIAYIKFQERL